jgi:hypothetical protein
MRTSVGSRAEHVIHEPQTCSWLEFPNIKRAERKSRPAHEDLNLARIPKLEPIIGTRKLVSSRARENLKHVTDKSTLVAHKRYTLRVT